MLYKDLYKMFYSDFYNKDCHCITKLLYNGGNRNKKSRSTQPR